MTREELHHAYAQAMSDLDALAVAWVEAHAAGRGTRAIADRITQQDKYTRKLERKLKKVQQEG